MCLNLREKLDVRLRLLCGPDEIPGPLHEVGQRRVQLRYRRREHEPSEAILDGVHQLLVDRHLRLVHAALDRQERLVGLDFEVEGYQELVCVRVRQRPVLDRVDVDDAEARCLLLQLIREERNRFRGVFVGTV